VTTIEGRDEWFAVLREVFGLGLQDVGSEERDALWDRVAAAHAAYATSP
jgi:hypothetical protein